MRELLVVLNTRAQSFLKRAFELRWKTVAQNLSSFVILTVFTVAVFCVSRFATDYLLTHARMGLFLFHRLLSMVLFVFFVTVNVGNMIVAYSTLYRSQEVYFLMSLPISHAKIFLIKFVDNFFYSSSTLTLLGVAVLLGYGSNFDLPWYFYFFVMFFILLPFMLIAGIVAITSLMLLIKLGTRIGFKILLAIIAAGYAGTVWLYFIITNPMQSVADVMRQWPHVNEYLGYLDPPFVKIMPSHWVAEFLYWSLHGNMARALPYFVMLFLTMLGLVVLAGLMARRFYYESWLAVADVQAGSHSRNSSGRSLFGIHVGFLNPQWSVMIKRDIALFLREPSQWLHLLLMFLLLGAFLASITMLRLSVDQPAARAAAFMIIFMFNGFLVASIALRFVFPMVSMEGDTFWSVRTAPIHIATVYWYKTLFALLAVSTIAEALTFTSVFLSNHDPMLGTVASITILCVSIALVGLNMGAGGYFAIYKEKNPIRVASSQGASLTFLASMVYLIVVGLVLIAPLSRYFIMADLVEVSSMRWALAPLVSIAALSLLVFSGSTILGLGAVKRVS